jgi:outer membrane receptor protein involved in Fe transport
MTVILFLFPDIFYWGIEIFGGVNNLLNVDYFSNIRINAAANRFFEPASGRTFYLGLRLNVNPANKNG